MEKSLKSAFPLTKDMIESELPCKVREFDGTFAIIEESKPSLKDGHFSFSNDVPSIIEPAKRRPLNKIEEGYTITFNKENATPLTEIEGNVTLGLTMPDVYPFLHIKGLSDFTKITGHKTIGYNECVVTGLSVKDMEKLRSSIYKDVKDASGSIELFISPRPTSPENLERFNPKEFFVKKLRDRIEEDVWKLVDKIYEKNFSRNESNNLELSSANFDPIKLEQVFNNSSSKKKTKRSVVEIFETSGSSDGAFIAELDSQILALHPKKVKKVKKKVASKAKKSEKEKLKKSLHHISLLDRSSDLKLYDFDDIVAKDFVNFDYVCPRRSGDFVENRLGMDEEDRLAYSFALNPKFDLTDEEKYNFKIVLMEAGECQRELPHRTIDYEEKVRYLPQRAKYRLELPHLPSVDPKKVADLSDTRASLRAARAEQRRLERDLEKTRAEESEAFKFNQLKVRKKKLLFAKSFIHSWGLFAREVIPKGEMVIEYVGEVVRAKISDFREQVYALEGMHSSYFFRIDEDLVIDATYVGNFARFINHW
eukprot:NODE_81_length_22758_cov_0.877797.p2 type:complete len:537 gc:universal NODE_81_length_22758_cov_0.877797:17208-18818(+)